MAPIKNAYATIYEKVEKILENLKQHCLILIDLGIMQSLEEQKPLDDLIQLCNLVQQSKMCSVVIGFSSGAGTVTSYNQRHLQPFLLTITSMRHCLFHSISTSEAKEYLNKRNNISYNCRINHEIQSYADVGIATEY